VPFDVIMPFYGDFQLLRVAVRSVLDQDDPDLRLVVVDDAYPDEEPFRWLQAIDDPRLVAMRNPENLGVSGSFRKAVDLAEGEHVCIMGCDDVMLPGYVRRVRALLRDHPGVDVVQPGVEVVDEHGRASVPMADRVKRALRPRGPRPLELGGERLAASLSTGNWCYFPSLAWRVETVARIGFRTDLHIVQDLAMLLAIAREGGSLLLDDEVVFAYRRHAASVSMAGAVDGSRFDQERRILAEEASAFDALGWRRAATAARLRATSRLNAATGLPAAVARRDRTGIRTLARHAFGRTADGRLAP
jgi:glycosyltransferase involved in cell wall biosynthesis